MARLPAGVMPVGVGSAARGMSAPTRVLRDGGPECGMGGGPKRLARGALAPARVLRDGGPECGMAGRHRARAGSWDAGWGDASGAG
ncbi:MAG: hypothetical protein LBE08_08415 [Bifidobacteriaceae bacterium]|nr:hypothetical protein [Bifidobacteriaceae bacterium]